jgi:hypothetical protein
MVGTREGLTGSLAASIDAKVQKEMPPAEYSISALTGATSEYLNRAATEIVGIC